MKVRELFVRSPRMTNKCVLNSGRKIPWKKFSGYVEVTFNISPLSSGQYSQKCFLRIFSKTLVWTIQCSFKQSFPNSFWKSSRYFSLRSWNKPSKNLSFQNKRQFFWKWYPGHAGCSSEKPTAKYSKSLKLTKVIFARNLSESFPLNTLNVVLPNLRKKFYRKSKKVQKKLPKFLHLFQKSSLLKFFLWTHRCSFVNAGKEILKILTKPHNF